MGYVIVMFFAAGRKGVRAFGGIGYKIIIYNAVRAPCVC